MSVCCIAALCCTAEISVCCIVAVCCTTEISVCCTAEISVCCIVALCCIAAFAIIPVVGGEKDGATSLTLQEFLELEALKSNPNMKVRLVGEG